MHSKRDLYGLHVAAFLLGGTALFSKLIPLPAWDITAWRGSIAAAVLMVLLLAARMPLKLQNRSQYLAMGVGGVLFAFHWMTYFYAIQVSTVAVGVIALFTFPVITAVMEPLLQRQRPSGRSLTTSAVVVVGVLLIGLDGQIGGNTALGLSLGVLSAFAYAGRNILQRRKLQGVAGPLVMLYQSAVTAIIFLPFLEVSIPAVSLDTWLLILLLSTVFTALPHSLVAHSLKSLNATSVSFIMALQVLYATLLAAFLLAEAPSLATTLGGLLIVAASVYTTVQIQRPSAGKLAEEASA